MRWMNPRFLIVAECHVGASVAIPECPRSESVLVGQGLVRARRFRLRRACSESVSVDFGESAVTAAHDEAR